MITIKDYIDFTLHYQKQNTIRQDKSPCCFFVCLSVYLYLRHQIYKNREMRVRTERGRPAVRTQGRCRPSSIGLLIYILRREQQKM